MGKRNVKSAGTLEADPQETIIDLEQCARDGQAPPRAQRYRIRIDKQHYVVAALSMTGRQLLKLADKAPAGRYMLSQKLRGGQVKMLGLDDVADFTVPGLERFMTLAKDQTEG
jgi:hypothetical protein